MHNRLFMTLPLIAALLIAGCATNEAPSSSAQEAKLKVTTTLFPLYDFARIVGSDHVQATMLLPAGAEAHSYEPKPSDILAVQNADIFIYIGEEMEPWAQDILEGVHNDDLTIITSTSFAEVISGEDHDHEEETDHEHMYDPHLWLSFANDILITQRIADEFSRLDPANEATYQANAQAYIAQLEALDKDYQETLANCGKDEFISGGHNVFAYLEQRYGIHGIEAIENLEPHTEPTPARLKEISDIVEEHGINYVLTEVLVNAQMAEAISEETGAEVLTFNPAANVAKKDFEAGTSFISIMRDNLATLATALECS